MRIVCDSCGKKYVISDDKVRGKLFKIRCKRCSHVIVVQGVEDPPATAEDDRTHVYSASAEQIAADMVTQSPPSVSGYQWHYVLDGEQAGPVSETEIAALYRDGIVNGDSYLWREGIDDWVHLRDVPVFADLVGGATLGPDSFDDDDGPELAIGNGAGNGSGYGDNMFGEDEATQIVSSASIGGGFGAAAAADVGVTAGLTSGGASARPSRSPRSRVGRSRPCPRVRGTTTTGSLWASMRRPRLRRLRRCPSMLLRLRRPRVPRPSAPASAAPSSAGAQPLR
jgi:predicted Zn finger-like uncharacterized protein